MKLWSCDDRTDEAKTLLRAETRRYDPLGSTARVYYESTKVPDDLHATERSHINYVVCDNDWERDVAKMLDNLDEVKAYVKNQGLGFVFPMRSSDGPVVTYPTSSSSGTMEMGFVNVILECGAA